MSTEREDVEAMVARIAGKAAARGVPREVNALGPGEVQRLRERLRVLHALPEPPLDQRLRERGVPERFVAAICAGELRATAASKLAFEAVDCGGLLILASGPGRGKSSAAAWALSRSPGLFVRSEQLAALDPTDSLDARMRTTRLLVVDDLGVEHSPGGYAAARLDAVVTFRWDNARATLLTTNLEPAAFRERYGARVASRANDARNPMGWRDLGGEDMRRSSP